MSEPKYGPSPWLDQFPKSRVPSYPRHRGVTATDVVDVVIVGGGLTGCATAYAFASAGAKVILLEADQIGRGTTALSSGWISEDPGVPFGDLEKAIGLRLARHAWQAWRRAALDFAALLRRLDIKCNLEERGSVTVAIDPRINFQSVSCLARNSAGPWSSSFFSCGVSGRTVHFCASSPNWED